MPRLALAEYAPDQGNFDVGAAVPVATNVIPVDGGYAPFPAVSRTDGVLAAEKRGVIELVYDGTRERFVGTATKLYRWNAGTSAYDDVTRASGGNYALGSDDFWTFEVFGDYVIAAYGPDDPQKFDLGAGATNFAALGGSPPNLEAICEHRDFIFGFENRADGQVDVNWSGVADSEIWDGTSLSDIQPIASGGPGRAIINIGDAVIFWQAYKCHRFIYTSNPDFIFSREEVEVGRGCVGKRAAVAAGGAGYFLAEDGFYSITAGGQVTPIGAGKVNDTFFRRVATVDLPLVLAVADPRFTRVYFVYRSSSAGSAPYDEVLIFDWRLQRWSLAIIDLQWLFSSSTPATTLEDLGTIYGNLEDVPAPLSDRRWRGADGVLGAFDGDGYTGTMTGSNMEASFETADLLNPANVRKLISRAMLVADVNNWTAQVGTRERLGDEINWSAASSLGYGGWARFRKSGRTARFRVTVPAGEQWTKAQGVEVELSPAFAPLR